MPESRAGADGVAGLFAFIVCFAGEIFGLFENRHTRNSRFMYIRASAARVWALSMMVLLPCAWAQQAQKIHVSYDKSVNFADFKTYASRLTARLLIPCWRPTS